VPATAAADDEQVADGPGVTASRPARIPVARIEGTGHYPQCEDPEGWLAAVLPGLE